MYRMVNYGENPYSKRMCEVGWSGFVMKFSPQTAVVLRDRWLKDLGADACKASGIQMHSKAKWLHPKDGMDTRYYR